MLLYKPFVTALRRASLLEPAHSPEKLRLNTGVVLTALFLIVSCVLLILSIHDVI